MIFLLGLILGEENNESSGGHVMESPINNVNPNDYPNPDD